MRIIWGLSREEEDLLFDYVVVVLIDARLSRSWTAFRDNGGEKMITWCYTLFPTNGPNTQ